MFRSHSISRVKAVLAFFLVLTLGASGAAFASGTAKQQTPARNSPNFDAYLMKEVRHQLVLLPYYSVFDVLQFKVEGSRVTLMGEVAHATLKDDAQAAVKGIEGVESIDNQIEILPPSSFDDQIRRQEYQAIYSFASLQIYSSRAVAPIHIIVNGGHVTLEGSVSTQQDKDAAGIRANTVPNVFSVTNNLQVEGSK
jgi:hyperosmotically inducible protein